MHGTKLKKPPACDACKARRVLCHPQPQGAPCPRCAEKNIRCVTSGAHRGRPRKILTATPPESIVVLQETQPPVSQPAPSSAMMSLWSPNLNEVITEDLAPELVAHFFHCFDLIPPAMNPIITVTSIKTTIRAVSYQLYLLPSQSRVLARCIIAVASLISFSEVMLGEDPRPESFSDLSFFASRSDVLFCGVRRSGPHRQFHAAALKAAWDAGIMLQVSNENTASCFLLDFLEQNSCGLSRPWASAYMSHLRALAPLGWTCPIVPSKNTWAAFLMMEALNATSNRKPILSTRDDQLLFAGPLENTAPKGYLSPSGPISSTSHASHGNYGRRSPGASRSIYRLCISWMLDGYCIDRARLAPLSEAAVLRFLGSLATLHAITARQLDRVDAALARTTMPMPPSDSNFADDDGTRFRRAASGILLGFPGLALPLHRELEARAAESHASSESAHTEARMRLLRMQVRETAALGARELARGIRYLPPIHYPYIPWRTLRDYAHFALDEAESAQIASPDQIRDLETFAGEIGLVGYSLDLYSTPQNAALVARLSAYIANANANASRSAGAFDPEDVLANMFLPLDQGWLDPTFAHD
ncbi:hypothetical protein FB451DRAFT_1573681 [Mycena latifolia]|nr:hypothetical protein FB451DRAFT_1573681 [Mycena latifolia]